MEDLKIVERCSWSSDYLSIWLKKELWVSTVMKEILMSGCKYGSNDDHKGTVKYMILNLKNMSGFLRFIFL